MLSDVDGLIKKPFTYWHTRRTHRQTLERNGENACRFQITIDTNQHNASRDQFIESHNIFWLSLQTGGGGGCSKIKTTQAQPSSSRNLREWFIFKDWGVEDSDDIWRGVNQSHVRIFFFFFAKTALIALDSIDCSLSLYQSPGSISHSCTNNIFFSFFCLSDDLHYSSRRKYLLPKFWEEKRKKGLKIEILRFVLDKAKSKPLQ